MIRLFCSAIIVLILTTVNGFAQSGRQYSGLFDTYYYRGPFSITVGAGGTAYNGDLGVFNKPSYAFSIGANYKLWPRIALGAEFLYYQLQGSKTTSLSDSTSATSSFSSTNMELDLYGRFYLIDDIVRVAVDRNKKPKLVKPYITLGVGFFNYHPTLTTTYTGFQAAIPAQSVSASGVSLAVPGGLGILFGITPRVSVATEVTYRYTLSNNLDAVANQKDGYLLAAVKLQYSPFAPKGKKKSKGGTPPAQYDGPKGTETWKNRKKEPPRQQEEYQLPGEEQQNPDNPDNPENPENQDLNQDQQNQDQGGENQDQNNEQAPEEEQKSSE